MKERAPTTRPLVGRFLDGHGRRIPILKGDWNDPPARVLSNIQRLNIYSSEGFVSSHTDFLARFPRLHTLRIRFDHPLDLSGLYRLPRLRDLTILGNWLPPKHLILDLARLPPLRRFSSYFSANIRGWERLDQLTELRLDHVYGIKRLDLSHHPHLQTLDLGPANGVEEVCLAGLNSLRSLTLACMARLTSLTGSEFYETVTTLDIRASNKLPPSVLARFTRLQRVDIGLKSNVTGSNFPLCTPRIAPFPV